MEEYNLKTKVVGVDISTESTTYAIVDIRGNILAEDSFDTSDYPDVNNFVTALSEKIVMLVEANGGYDTIRSIGVSSPSASKPILSSVQFSSVAQSCPTLCDPMDCSMPGFPVHHQLPKLAQTHVH